MEDSEPEEQIALLTDNKHTKVKRNENRRTKFSCFQVISFTFPLLLQKMICSFLENLDKFHHYTFPVLRCLHAMTSKLAKYPLGKQVTAKVG